jgi:glycosyltransferase involved in cell wall biosynthesis
MKKIAFVVHRYGIEVNGGAETYCRVMAEKLKDHYEVEVITSCALDYMTWEDYYLPGEEQINGITVRRFSVDHPRNIEKFNKLNEKMVQKPNRSKKDEEEWVRAQGPTSRKLIDYLEEHEQEYDAFLFVTYLYYHTVKGLEKVKDKAILIPTAHDEPPIYYSIYDKIFHEPKAIIYLTEEEKVFVHKKFHNEYIPSEVIGMGIDIPKTIDKQAFKEKYNLDNYLIYVGRIDESKGCKEMFQFFTQYKKETKSKVKLVLMGKAAMEIPEHSDIISLGFVSEEDKFNGIKGAEILLLPSPYESFSIAMLEGLALGIPAVVNGRCEVLKGHCIRSNGALYYETYEEFKETLSLLISKEGLLNRMGINGTNYVEDKYKWSSVIEDWIRVIENKESKTC